MTMMVVGMGMAVVDTMTVDQIEVFYWAMLAIGWNDYCYDFVDTDVYCFHFHNLDCLEIIVEGLWLDSCY